MSSDLYLGKAFISFFILLAVLAVSCTSRRDEDDALKAAGKIHSQFQRGEYVAVYQEAADGLKRAIDEQSFVAAMRRLHEGNGILRKITPIGYQTGIDSRSGRNYILLFDLEFERLRARERLVFIRSQSQRMELWDLVMDKMQ